MKRVNWLIALRGWIKKYWRRCIKRKEMKKKMNGEVMVEEVEEKKRKNVFLVWNL